jgi:hypothetical protein
MKTIAHQTKYHVNLHLKAFIQNTSHMHRKIANLTSKYNVGVLFFLCTSQYTLPEGPDSRGYYVGAPNSGAAVCECK